VKLKGYAVKVLSGAFQVAAHYVSIFSLCALTCQYFLLFFYLHVCIVETMSLIAARERYRRVVADAKQKYSQSGAKARAALDLSVAEARAGLERAERIGRYQIASMGGKARAVVLSEDRRREIASNAAAALNERMTSEQRRASAQRAAWARWGKPKTKPRKKAA